MNIFTKKIHAAPSAAIAARTTVLSAFVVCSVFAASLALAQNQPPPRRDDQQQMQAQRYEQVQRSNSNDTRLREQRDARSFDTRAEEQRRASEGADARLAANTEHTANADSTVVRAAIAALGAA